MRRTREKYSQNYEEVDTASDGNEIFYVSRNDLPLSDRGLGTSGEARKTYSRTFRNEHYYKGSLRVAERNFLSHAEFPDVETAATLSSGGQTGKTNMYKCSTNKVAKFKPFDPNKAPTHFQNCNKNINSQNYQNYNPCMTDTSHCYTAQGQAIYQFIPPTVFGQGPGTQQGITMIHSPMTSSGTSATAVAPNGERIYIPLDDSKYEIRRSNHDLSDMPQDYELHPLATEGQFESSVYSPRPIDTRGSLSDDWSGSSDDGRDTETESEHETETTETDESEIANRYVTNVLKSITESVENLAVEEGIESYKEDDRQNESIQTSKENDDGTKILLESPDIIDEIKGNLVETDEREEMPDKSMNNVTDVHNVTSSSSDADDDITAKRANSEEELKTLDETSGCKEQHGDEVIVNKRPRSKKSRAWKENRKGKQDKNKDKTKLNGKENDISDIVGNKIKDTKNIEKDCVERDFSYDPTGSVQHKTGNSEIVTVDGQGYFQPGQIQNGQYQQYYIPDDYTFVQNQYQQFQTAMDPNYTMFIHDACPPPSWEEGYNQVHKSLSGELINLKTASEYHPQIVEGGKTQQTSAENVRIISDSTSNDTATEMIQSNTEAAGTSLDQGAENASLSYTLNPYEQYPCNNQFYSGAVADSSVTEPAQDQGQLYVCYDEDSVYVDPESGLSYPALHMTEDNLVTVILREGVFLEITANKALRLVNHEKKLVVAINDTGSKTCVIHPAARIYQSDSSVHAELYLSRRAKMTDELVLFGNKLQTYKFDHRMVTEMEEWPVFRDLSHDDSVAFLSTECGSGNEDTKFKMNEILSHAHFWKNGIRGSTVIINGTKIVQNEKGEVSVYCGPIRFLRMNPEKMILRLKTHYVEIDIETNWNVKVTRGSHALNASHIGFIVCNGKIKACLDSNNKFQSFSMPDHRVLMLGQPVSQHRPGVPERQRGRRAHSRKEEPEGDHLGYVHRNQDDEQSRVFREWEEGWDHYFDQWDNNHYKRWDPQAGRWVYPTREWHCREHR